MRNRSFLTQTIMAGLLCAGMVLATTAASADITVTPQDTSGYTDWDPNNDLDLMGYDGSWDSTSPLNAYNIYPETGTNLPLVVSMHGYSESAGMYIPRTEYLASEGWFVSCVAMRGRDGSAGAHDSGGVEVHDIYDAVQSILTAYDGMVDPSRIVIQGWSGGGGNTTSAVTKLPDTFNAAASYFGMSDYEEWQYILDATNPTYPGPAHRIGETPAEAPHRYIARNSNLGATNNHYTNIFLFNDEEEPTCYPYMNQEFYDNAVANGQTNVTLTITGPGDSNRYMHGGSWDVPSTNDLYLTPVKNGDPGWGPVEMDDSGDLTVLGFVVTKKFRLYAGDGQDAAANVSYSIDGDTLTFTSTTFDDDPSWPGAIDPTKDFTVRIPANAYHGVISATVDGSPATITEVDGTFEVVAPSLDSEVVIQTGHAPEARSEKNAGCTIEGYKTFDVLIDTDTTLDWTNARLSLQLNQGDVYQDPTNDADVPQSGLWASNPDLEWDSFVAAPGMAEPGIATAPGDGFRTDGVDIAFFDLVDTNGGEFTAARITVSENAVGTWMLTVYDEVSDGEGTVLTGVIAEVGDTDLDNDVDATDLANLGMAWDPAGDGADWYDGDFDGDGDVDATDLAALGMQWNPAGFGNPIPEPASLSLLALGGIALLRRRNR